jgi:hypothetical protein
MKAKRVPGNAEASQSKQRRGWRDNHDRIARRIDKPDWRDHGQSFGAANPGQHIDPANVDVIIPAEKPIIQPEWTEIPVDDAFWRVWKMNSLQMRRNGYQLHKIDGKWRAFYVNR